MDIRFESNLTQSQKEACLLAAYMDKQDKITRAHNHPLWLEAKSMANSMKKEILLKFKQELYKD